MFILSSLYFALPIYLGNMAPVLVKKLPFLDLPIDGGAMYKGKPLFGKNKTWRGVVFAVLFGVLAAYLQRWIGFYSPYFDSLALLDYNTDFALLLGGVMGFGAIMGDLLKSFFKRRVGVESGKPWVPFDQVDLAIGGLVFGAILFWPGISYALTIVLVTPILHWVTNVFAYFLRLKEVPW